MKLYCSQTRFVGEADNLSYFGIYESPLDEASSDERLSSMGTCHPRFRSCSFPRYRLHDSERMMELTIERRMYDQRL